MVKFQEMVEMTGDGMEGVRKKHGTSGKKHQQHGKKQGGNWKKS